MPDEHTDSIYEPQNRDDLVRVAEARRLEVQGTGANGYVSKDDLVGALDADDQTLGVGERFKVLEAERNQLRERVEAMENARDDASASSAGPSESREIERENDTSWWCPFDDHANAQLLNACGKCHATRDGDTVTRH